MKKIVLMIVIPQFISCKSDKKEIDKKTGDKKTG
jgi:hypothetical protein